MSGAVQCDLCEARRFTTWYFEDEQCWIADCEICDVPMVVWRVHDPTPPDDVRAHLYAALSVVADGRFGADGYRIDDNMRNIPDHFHAHARNRAWHGVIARPDRTILGEHPLQP